MMTAREDLSAAIASRVRVLGQRPAPPVSADQLAGVEALLGFRLPTLLCTVYSRIGNGGFGPGRGLLPICGPGPQGLGQNAIEVYRNAIRPMPDCPDMIWPERMLPFCWWGEGVFSYADGSEPGPPVYRLEPPTDWTWDVQGYRFHPQGMSLGQWLLAWVEGRDLRPA
jgi:hypothetical protein